MGVSLGVGVGALIEYNYAIRPVHPSHPMSVALVLPRGGQILLLQKSLTRRGKGGTLSLSSLLSFCFSRPSWSTFTKPTLSCLRLVSSSAQVYIFFQIASITLSGFVEFPPLSSLLPHPVLRLPSVGSRPPTLGSSRPTLGSSPPHGTTISKGRRVLGLVPLGTPWRHPPSRVFRPISHHHFVGSQALFRLHLLVYSHPHSRSRSRPHPYHHAHSRPRSRSRPHPRRCSLYLFFVLPVRGALFSPRGHIVWQMAGLTPRKFWLPAGATSFLQL